MVLYIPKALITDGEKILILKRAAHSRSFPGLWDFAGGKPDPGETLEETLVREVREETGYTIRVGAPLGEYETTLRAEQIRFTVFAVEVIAGTLQLSGDHSEFRWSTPEEILQLETMAFVKPFLSSLN